MTEMVSVVIPNRNKAASLTRCLEALYRSSWNAFEVIVVDDGSEDRSVQAAQAFPCTLISLAASVGAAEARNIGARQARGRLLFFIDSDCMVQPDTLSRLMANPGIDHPRIIIGGSYTERPFDPGFFSFFQSILVHYSETRNRQADYIATHALAMDAEQFRRSGGFARHFLPILEDVDFSHRMRRNGYRLLMDSALLVRHDFRYGLKRSLANGFNKARYWLLYSLKNGDLLADSGTASRELKINLLSFLLLSLLGISCQLSGGVFSHSWQWLLTGVVAGANLLSCRRLLGRFFQSGGTWFGLRACGYFLLVYPLAVWAGAGRGLAEALTQWASALFGNAVPVSPKRGAIRGCALLEIRKP